MSIAPLKQRLRMEAMLMLASRSNRVTLIATAVLLLLSAIWSGLGARELRAQQWATTVAAHQLVEKADRDVAQSGALPPLEAAMHAFLFGRSDAAPAFLAGGGGMALSGSQFALLTPEVRVSVDSRLTDGRRGEGLDNPLLAGRGQLDLATVTVIFTPLAALVLCAGLVQRERMLGIWRTVSIQHACPLRLLALRLLVRAIFLIATTVAASVPAFLLDPGATLFPALLWFIFTALYVALWVAIGGLLCLLRTEAATALTVGLALWLFTLFVVPMVLQMGAELRYPSPSRLADVVQLRATHLRLEEQEAPLLQAWYAQHPAWQPPAALSHTWPITFLPRHAAFDRELRPLLRYHDDLRAMRFEWQQRFAWLAPPLALVMAADRLAGIDAPRHARFMHDADRYEDQWRAAIVPRVMSYRGLTPELLEQLPRFETTALSPSSTLRALWWGLSGMLYTALFAVVLGRSRLLEPG